MGRSNARARQTKQRARLERYEQMAADAEKSRKLDFEDIQIHPDRAWEVSSWRPPGSPRGMVTGC